MRVTIAALLCLALCNAAALAAPISLSKRISAIFTFANDGFNLVPVPAVPVESTVKRKVYLKAVRIAVIAQRQNDVRTARRAEAQARVQEALNAAEAAGLRFQGPIDVKITGTLHQSKEDLQDHYTFTFADSACGAGDCTGHAYLAGGRLTSPGKNQMGKIYSSDHKTIFGEFDLPAPPLRDLDFRKVGPSGIRDATEDDVAASATGVFDGLIDLTVSALNHLPHLPLAA